MIYSLYTGCTPKVAEPELLKSALALAEHLGWELIEKKEFTCCGGSHLQDISGNQALFINARNLAYADEEGLDLVTLCNTCQFVLADYRNRLLNDKETAAAVNNRLKESGLEFTGKSRVRHFLYVLIEELGYNGIQERVVKQLEGLKVASFYGCHNIRPAAVQGDVNMDESPWKPRSLDKLVQALGGTPVYYPEANSCCGFHASLYAGKTSSRLSGNILRQAYERGADLIITPCPLCHTNLDAAQYEAKLAVGLGVGFPLPIPSFLKNFELTPTFIKEDFEIPVLHFEQLIGLAWGIDKRKLGFKHNIISYRKNKKLKVLIEK